MTINAIHQNTSVVISGVAGRPANRFGHTVNGNQNTIPLSKNDKLQVPHIGLMSATRERRCVLSLFRRTYFQTTFFSIAENIALSSFKLVDSKYKANSLLLSKPPKGITN